METIRIEAADWAIVWDPERERHVYRRDVDVWLAGDRIVHIGPGYAGGASRTLSGRGRLAMPGLVDLHSHLASENMGRGVTEEVGTPALYMTGVHEPKPLFLPGHSMSTGFLADPAEGMRAATRMAVAELLLSGTTTVVDLGVSYDGWLDTLAETGIRAVVGYMYRSAAWVVRDGHRVDYAWDEGAGRAGLETASAWVERAGAHPSGRLSGLLSPAQVDTCSAELLTESAARAEALGVPLTLHTCQSVWDLLELTRRHGLTPVQWLAGLGVLSPRMVLGHAMFLDHHSAVPWHSREDVGLIAASGASVAHCPTVMSRYGQTLESLGGYLRAGINVTLGTDTQPHNMLEEARTATILSRIGGHHVHDHGLGEVFHAATVGGARALGRDDLGRIAPGAKADLVLVDLTHPAMRPVRDPLRSLVYSAADRAVRDVFVDGRQVVRDGKVTTIDRDAAATVVEALQRDVLANVSARDRAGRGAEEISPLSLALE